MDIFVGFIAAFGFTFAPRNWMQCAGQLVAISDNSTMYSLLSNYYGGDGRSTFGIPEMRGRLAIGYGNGPGLSPVGIGAKAGSERHLIQIADLPYHAHNVDVKAGSGGGEATGTLTASRAAADLGQPTKDAHLASISTGRTTFTDSYVATAPTGSDVVTLGGLNVSGGGGALPSVTVAGAGSTNNSISLASPFIAINYSIVAVGIYPSRN